MRDVQPGRLQMRLILSVGLGLSRIAILELLDGTFETSQKNAGLVSAFYTKPPACPHRTRAPSPPLFRERQGGLCLYSVTGGKALFLKNFSDLVLSMNSPNRIRAALPLRPLRFAAKPLSPDDCIRRPAADTNRLHRHGRTTPSQQLSSRKDRIRLPLNQRDNSSASFPSPVAGIAEHIRFLVIQNIASYLFPETGRSPYTSNQSSCNWNASPKDSPKR